MGTGTGPARAVLRLLLDWQWNGKKGGLVSDTVERTEQRAVFVIEEPLYVGSAVGDLSNSE